MSELLGEFDCKLDARGRLRVPSQILRVFSEMEVKELRIYRGVDGCLILSSVEVWEKERKELESTIDLSKKEHREYRRAFYRGSFKIEIDSSDRILVPVKMREFAMLEKDVILYGMNNVVEIWPKDLGEEKEINSDDYTNLYSEVKQAKPKGSPTTDSPQGPS